MLTESMVRTRAREQPRPTGRLGNGRACGTAGEWPCLQGGQVSRRLPEDAGKILTEIRWILESDRHPEDSVAGVGPVAVQLVPPEAEG